jgi:hypothetical protein
MAAGSSGELFDLEKSRSISQAHRSSEAGRNQHEIDARGNRFMPLNERTGCE